MCWMRMGGEGWVGRMWVGSPVWVARSKLGVADLCRDHELLGDHDVHGDEVTLEGLDAAVAVVLVVAPVVLQVEQGLRLEDGVLQVSLHPLHPGNTLVTSERPLLGVAGPHGGAHVPCTLVARDEPVNNSTKHVRVVLSKVVRAALLVLLLNCRTIVLGQVL